MWLTVVLRCFGYPAGTTCISPISPSWALLFGNCGITQWSGLEGTSKTMQRLKIILPGLLGPCCPACRRQRSPELQLDNTCVLTGVVGRGQSPLGLTEHCLLQPNRDGLLELVLGGFFYCLGMVFFKSDGRIPFAHAIWHLFVAIGAGIHYYAIWRYLYRPGALDTDTSR